MVVADAGVLEHPLQVADQLPVGPSRNRRLVQVQGAGKGRLDRLLIQVGRHGRGSRVLHQGLDRALATGDRRQGCGAHVWVTVGSSSLV